MHLPLSLVLSYTKSLACSLGSQNKVELRELNPSPSPLSLVLQVIIQESLCSPILLSLFFIENIQTTYYHEF